MTMISVSTMMFSSVLSALVTSDGQFGGYAVELLSPKIQVSQIWCTSRIGVKLCSQL